MANIDSRIVGIWRMVGTKGADDSGKALPPPYGPKAMGLVTFQADGRMMAVLCDGRREMPGGEARPFMSYAGNYTFDGTTLSTRVDASSDAGRIGGDQFESRAPERLDAARGIDLLLRPLSQRLSTLDGIVGMNLYLHANPPSHQMPQPLRRNQ